MIPKLAGSSKLTLKMQSYTIKKTIPLVLSGENRMCDILLKVALDFFFTVIAISAGICLRQNKFEIAGLLLAIALAVAIKEAFYVANRELAKPRR